MLCILVSCTGDNQDLYDKFKKIKMKSAGPIERMPEFKPSPKFSYPINSNKRNPFLKYMSEQKNADKRKKMSDLNAPNLKRRRQNLEKFKLRDLNMVGVLKQHGTIWGLVRTPDKVIHKVTIGSYLGRDFGRVVAIKDNKIRLNERYKDNKTWKRRDIYLLIEKTNKKTVNPKAINVEEIIK